MSVIGRLVDIAVHQNQNVLSAAQDQAQRLLSRPKIPQLNRSEATLLISSTIPYGSPGWEVLEHLGDHGFMRISYLGVPTSWLP